ncbi:hypothetical protein FIBSPDRAFT_933411 [Athelia psychrophila]|uniref:Uncharacterized protein n=1 Tax=Athelia psychrophila TaxID=1759441 RepID=A0A166H3C0_9AGAM|nr:hypothetical protein FIBSPDRAFT_933411 [Fibularhizoctonia sp. CBS 109695]
MLSIEIIAWALLLGGNCGISMSAAEPLPPDSEGSHCTVQAWVRAEDLIPSSILNGDLRIKVDPSCSEEIVSVALQLRLDEYAEVKFPSNTTRKKGVVMPTEPVCGNMSSEDDTSMRRPPVWIRDNMEGSEDDTSMWRLPVRIRDNMEDSDTEMGCYYAALRDPDIWEVHAEERTAWKAAVTLHEGSFAYLESSFRTKAVVYLITLEDRAEHSTLGGLPSRFVPFHSNLHPKRRFVLGPDLRSDGGRARALTRTQLVWTYPLRSVTVYGGPDVRLPFSPRVPPCGTWAARGGGLLAVSCTVHPYPWHWADSAYLPRHGQGRRRILLKRA